MMEAALDFALVDHTRLATGRAEPSAFLTTILMVTDKVVADGESAAMAKLAAKLTTLYLDSPQNIRWHFATPPGTALPPSGSEFAAAVLGSSGGHAVRHIDLDKCAATPRRYLAYEHEAFETFYL